jgi:hypothetical protein
MSEEIIYGGNVGECGCGHCDQCLNPYTEIKESHTERVREHDKEANTLWEECERLGIVADIGKRWEDGIDHHPEARAVFDLVKKADWVFGEDYFCWKSGGDGDNGETLMYALSVLFELRDKTGLPLGVQGVDK